MKNDPRFDPQLYGPVTTERGYDWATALNDPNFDPLAFWAHGDLNASLPTENLPEGVSKMAGPVIVVGATALILGLL